ncbi:MAG TPA: Ku protein [Dehalococcoidia bacterium]
MPRPLWKGAVRFGMVSIPIKLYSATEEKDVRFNQLHKEDMSRIRQKVFCAEEDIELDRDDIVKGYQIAPGQYVVMDDEDFDKVPISTTREIEVTQFVDLDKIDPIYYQKTYYLEPEDIGMKPFALLMAALKDSERVAVAKISMRQKEQLCTLRVYGNTIALETMFYADEVRDTEGLAVPDKDVKISDKELAMAKTLVDMLSDDEFNLGEYRDNYRDALLDVIKAKSEGQTIETPAPAVAKVTDLMDALRASVEAAKARKSAPEKAEAESEEDELSKRRRRRAS